MKNNKAPGGTGLSMDMLKNLPTDALNFLCKSIQEFWTNHNTDFDTCHVTSLNILYKGKGDSQNLNNFREICLKESTAKIMSVIISNRLLKRLHDIED
jgi:hypothetical protein